MTPLFIYRYLNKNFQDDWLTFEPETFKDITINKKEIDKEDLNKILALQTALNSQSNDTTFFFTNWQIFEKIVLSFNDVVPNFEEVEQVEPHEIQAVITLFEKIKKVDFNDEVASYIAASYETENIVHCPFSKKVDEKLEDDKLKKQVKQFLEKVDLDTPNLIEEIVNLNETPLTIQIRKLLFIKEYVKVVVKENGEKR